MEDDVQSRLHDPASLDHLTGKAADTPYPHSIGASGSGAKFTPDGKLLSFPGNTFLCHIDPSSDAFCAISEVQAGLKHGPAADHFTYLPPASFHMTIFSGVCGIPLGHDGWPEGFPIGTDLTTLTEAFQDRLNARNSFERVTIVPNHFSLGYSLQFVGATLDDKEQLWSAREMLQGATGIRRPDFLDYCFHISIAYQIRWMTRELAQRHLNHSSQLFQRFKRKAPSLTLGPVEFCTFDNMHQFDTQMRVPTASNKSHT